MTAEENKVLMHRFIEEIMNGRNLHGADEFFADDFVDHQGGIGPTGGREAVKAFVATLTGGFPDMRFEAVNMVAEGDRVFAHVVGRGTHSGDFAGIPATGREVTAAGMSVVRVAHGKVVERWNITDFAGLMKQITS